MDLGRRGIRSLAVARTNDEGKWQMMGILTFLDPPRPDTKITIERAMEYGVDVKMITGELGCGTCCCLFWHMSLPVLASCRACVGCCYCTAATNTCTQSVALSHPPSHKAGLCIDCKPFVRCSQACVVCVCLVLASWQ